jgi:hypothetical protein
LSPSREPRAAITSSASPRRAASAKRRPAGARVAYRIVDEYDCEFTCKPRTTRQPLTLDELVKMIDGSSEDAECSCANDFTALLAPDNDNAAQAAARIEERFWRAFRQMHELVRRLDEYGNSLQFAMVGMLVKESAANMLRAGIAMRDALAHISRKVPPTEQE